MGHGCYLQSIRYFKAISEGAGNGRTGYLYDADGKPLASTGPISDGQCHAEVRQHPHPPPRLRRLDLSNTTVHAYGA